jgi:hypothetical protein
VVRLATARGEFEIFVRGTPEALAEPLRRSIEESQAGSATPDGLLAILTPKLIRSGIEVTDIRGLAHESPPALAAAMLVAARTLPTAHELFRRWRLLIEGAPEEDLESLAQSEFLVTLRPVFIDTLYALDEEEEEARTWLREHLPPSVAYLLTS